LISKQVHKQIPFSDIAPAWKTVAIMIPICIENTQRSVRQGNLQTADLKGKAM